EIRAHRLNLRVALDELLVRTRHGADAALESFGHKLREQIEQTVRVFDSLARRPVRHVYLLLNSRAVKLAVRKTVNRENVAVLFVEPAWKCDQRLALAQFARRLVAKAQTNRVRFAGADAISDRQRVAVERSERFRPRFAAMNVRAIRQMQAVSE